MTSAKAATHSSGRGQEGHGFKAFLSRVVHSWATRSLAIGAFATAVDVGVLLATLHFLKFPKPVAAMSGVLVGSTLTFFLNRRFAFDQKNQEDLGPQLLKFVVTTGLAMGVHAGVVWLLSVHFHLYVVFAKFAADILVFSVGQLFIFKYIVFRKK